MHEIRRKVEEVMARIRTIKPEFPQSESMGRVSREARLLFIQLWTVVDDSGRTRAASRMLASLLYPYDDDAKSLIDGWMEELERENCLVRYQIDGHAYLEIRNWRSHQKIDKPSPSKMPEPREDSRTVARIREDSSEDQGSRIKDQGPRSSREDSRGGVVEVDPDEPEDIASVCRPPLPMPQAKPVMSFLDWVSAGHPRVHLSGDNRRLWDAQWDAYRIAENRVEIFDAMYDALMASMKNPGHRAFPSNGQEWLMANAPIPREAV
jgi:hypothetical protein